MTRAGLYLILAVALLFSMGLLMVFNTTAAEVIDRSLSTSTHTALLKQIVYGKAAPIIACELESHLPMVVVDRFADAVKWAKLEAKINDVVLLSPGCSSFDQFESYKQRGSEFKRLVRES